MKFRGMRAGILLMVWLCAWIVIDGSRPAGTEGAGDTFSATERAEGPLAVVGLSGTYKIFTQGAGFWQYSGGAQPAVAGMVEGTRSTVLFDGAGGCTGTNLADGRFEGWNPVEGFTFSEPPWTCTYTVGPKGWVTVTTSDGNFGFQLSEDSQTLVGLWGMTEAHPDGTDYYVS